MHLSKSAITRAVSRYAREHGFSVSTVRACTSLLRSAIHEHGEREFRTYGAWKRAIIAINPSAVFDGNSEVCCAPQYGEWDGEKGIIYSPREVHNV